MDVPWALPDDRWQRAIRILERRGYATLKRDGELVQRAVRCLRRLYQARTPRGVRSTALKFPDVYWALRLHQEDSLRPLELRARVLAGQPDPVIARLISLPPRTVQTYVALFFDVRDRLQAGPWIRWVVLGLRPDRAPAVESLLLQHAWQRGPTVIEPWLDWLQHRGETRDLSTGAGRQMAWIGLLVRVQQLPIDEATSRRLWKLSRWTLGNPSETLRSAMVSGVIHRNRDRILREVTWKQPASGEDGAIPDAMHGRPDSAPREAGSLVRAG